MHNKGAISRFGWSISAVITLGDVPKFGIQFFGVPIQRKSRGVRGEHWLVPDGVWEWARVNSHEEKGHGMKMKAMRNWIMVLLMSLSTAAMCAAQGDTARLQGTVTDPQGNAVSGATVNVTSTETGRLSTATTNELGYYTVPALPPGNYRVDVTLK